MGTRREDVARRLPQARAGSTEALGDVLEACRGYLLQVARRALQPDLQAKAGASDLVQQTFLEAQRDFARFGGHSEAELIAWLRRLLLNNVANFARDYRATAKRTVDREVALAAEDSALGLQLAASWPSPSTEAMANEQAEGVRRALDKLPAHYRDALVWRHVEQLSFEEIGERLGRTANAARKIWARAVELLQQTREEQP